MTQNDLTRALAELAGSTERPVAARLREVFPAIESALSAGATRKQVLKVLNENGFRLELGVFITNLHRLRKKERQQKPIRNAHSTKPSSRSLTTQAPVGDSDRVTAGSKNPLRQLSEAQQADNLDPRRDIGLPFGQNVK